MTDFQVISASVAILLEVFSVDTKKDSHEQPNTFGSENYVRRMQDRVANGEFWNLLGGTSEIENTLKKGFKNTFKNVQGYDDKGNPFDICFPIEIEELFSAMKDCNRTIESLTHAANLSLPFLRAFVDNEFKPYEP